MKRGNFYGIYLLSFWASIATEKSNAFEIALLKMLLLSLHRCWLYPQKALLMSLDEVGFSAAVEALTHERALLSSSTLERLLPCWWLEDLPRLVTVKNSNLGWASQWTKKRTSKCYWSILNKLRGLYAHIYFRFPSVCIRFLSVPNIFGSEKNFEPVNDPAYGTDFKKSLRRMAWDSIQTPSVSRLRPFEFSQQA